MDINKLKHFNKLHMMDQFKTSNSHNSNYYVSHLKKLILDKFGTEILHQNVLEDNYIKEVFKSSLVIDFCSYIRGVQTNSLKSNFDVICKIPLSMLSKSDAVVNL